MAQPSEGLRAALSASAPGRPLREGLDRILLSGMGALIGSTGRYNSATRQAAQGLRSGTNQGLNRARSDQYTIQRRYNTAYTECMRAQSRGY